MPQPLLHVNASQSGWRQLLARIDAYTLWAFNPQATLAPRTPRHTDDQANDA